MLPALLCEALYGLSYVYTKSAGQHARALALLGWRFVIAAIVRTLIIGMGWAKVELRSKSIRPLLLIALFSPIFIFLGETTGIWLTTASESGVLLACIPIAALISSTWIGKTNGC